MISSLLTYTFITYVCTNYENKVSLYIFPFQCHDCLHFCGCSIAKISTHVVHLLGVRLDHILKAHPSQWGSVFVNHQGSQISFAENFTHTQHKALCGNVSEKGEYLFIYFNI